MKGTKPPFQKGTMRWALFNEDFSDLTIDQIAEVFDTQPGYVTLAMKRVFQKTGVRVKYTAKNTQGEPIGVVEYGGA